MNNKRVISLGGLVLVIVAALLMYAQRQDTISLRPIGKPIHIVAPLGLPPVPIPADNPPTAETVALGRKLYYDPQLSLDKTVSCASCHTPDHGFSDPKPVSVGVGKKTGTRHSPAVVNAAYYNLQFWDGRAPSLEKQAEGPVQNPVEMAHTLKGVEDRLNADAAYRAEFDKAFGRGPITYDKVEKCIASFERTVISGNSPFDRWYYGHDANAVDESAKRGFQVFSDPKKGNCTACHLVGEKYALFTDNKFHNIGVGIGNDFKPTDAGRYAETKQPQDTGAFKTPSLRNVAQRAPYFHDSSSRTLKDAIDFYIGGGSSNDYLDKEIHALDFLTFDERADLLAFLESLTGETPKNSGPPSETLAGK